MLSGPHRRVLAPALRSGRRRNVTATPAALICWPIIAHPSASQSDRACREFAARAAAGTCRLSRTLADLFLRTAGQTMPRPIRSPACVILHDARRMRSLRQCGSGPNCLPNSTSTTTARPIDLKTLWKTQPRRTRFAGTPSLSRSKKRQDFARAVILRQLQREFVRVPERSICGWSETCPRQKLLMK